MKVECFQENLDKGLGIVVRAIPTKGTLPVLSNVLIKAEDGKVTLTTTNLETTITYTFGATVEEAGSITVPAKLLHEFVSNLPLGKIMLSSEGTNLSVISIPKIKSRFNGMSSIEFPEIPTSKSEEGFLELDPKILSDLVSHTSFSSSADVTRPVLTATLINYADGNLSIVATDGFRLSEKVTSITGEFKPVKVLVPTKTLLDVAKIFYNTEGKLLVIYDPEDSLVYFRADNTQVGVRIIDGVFPDYKRIIPSGKTHSISLNSQELVEAIKLTSVFSKGSSSPIKMELTDTGTIRIYSSSDSTGDHSSEFTADFEGEPVTFSFNFKYLNDFLNNVKVDKIVMESNGNTSPVVFKGEGLENYLHLIMPMKS